MVDGSASRRSRFCCTRARSALRCIWKSPITWLMRYDVHELLALGAFVDHRLDRAHEAALVCGDGRRHADRYRRNARRAHGRQLLAELVAQLAFERRHLGAPGGVGSGRLLRGRLLPAPAPRSLPAPPAQPGPRAGRSLRAPRRRRLLPTGPNREAAVVVPHLEVGQRGAAREEQDRRRRPSPAPAPAPATSGPDAGSWPERAPRTSSSRTSRKLPTRSGGAHSDSAVLTRPNPPTSSAHAAQVARCDSTAPRCASSHSPYT